VNKHIEPFTVDVPQAALDDLQARLTRARWPDAETVTDWVQGPPVSYMQDLARYWAEDYNWRVVERRLNQLPQFRTEIDGVRIHFLHVRSPHPDATPIILTHGWPSTMVEFLDIIDHLTEPSDPADAFHVVCPSLPGHGFSDRPATTGWTVQHIAEAWAELMARLGYDRYIAHGGDWGSWVSAALGSTDAEHLLGIHLTMPLAFPPEKPVELDERDQAAMERMKAFGQNQSGYSAIQSSRPQALAYGFADSPLGLAGWLVDRFYEWADHDGDLDTAIRRDTLLDILTMYWLTDTGTSSARLFWESFNKEPMNPASVPTGCSVSPHDAVLPRAWARERFTDLRHWKDLDSGGHFPALEKPDVLADELRTFLATLR
jgi:epoxide hydrolase